jgi:hypothetical protein
MNWEVPVQPVGQAGSPGKTTGVGLEVGVLRSSEEAPIIGAEQRRDTCPHVRSDRGRWPRQGIRRFDVYVINPDSSSRGKPGGRIGLGKPDTGNPSVRFDEGSESDGHWRLPFNPSAPAYSTSGAFPKHDSSENSEEPALALPENPSVVSQS